MELQKIIALLEELPDDAGLDEPHSWDDNVEWCQDIVTALKEAVEILKEKENHVGNMTINGKNYRIIE